MSQEVRDFYDNFADNYHLIFADWHASVLRQAAILEKFLQHKGIHAPATVLDCTCGIGTQAIGLALKGYRVHASDLSPRSIEAAQANAQKFQLAQVPQFSVANLLEKPQNQTSYAAVLSFDNAFAHFHEAEQLHTALETIRLQVQAGGLIAISIRDYDALVQNPPLSMPVQVIETSAGRRVTFQVWDWSEDRRFYNLQIFLVQQEGANWQTHVYPSRLRALQRSELTQALQTLGFEQIQWQMPAETGFYQPIVTAIAP